MDHNERATRPPTIWTNFGTNTVGSGPHRADHVSPRNAETAATAGASRVRATAREMRAHTIISSPNSTNTTIWHHSSGKHAPTVVSAAP
eukprot:3946252-Prymnesium_polylepis.1